MKTPRPLLSCCVALGMLAVSSAQAADLSDPDAAKAADKCQKQIGKVGGKFVKNKLKRLDKCLAGIFKCIQTKDATKQPACTAKAAAKCDKELAKIFASDEPKLEDGLLKKCDDPGTLDIADLRSPDGLDFQRVALFCDTEYDLALVTVDEVARCVRTHKECRVEQIFRAQFPRAAELLDFAGVDGALVANLTCLTGSPGPGTGFGDTDPKGDGKIVDKCAKEIRKAGAKFVTTKLKSLEKCLGAVFKCVQTKPGDDGCITKASGKCDKELGAGGKIAKAEAKLRSSVEKRCSDFTPVFGTIGLHVDDLTMECARYDVPGVATLNDYVECLYRQHECLVDDMVALQYPRTEELLAEVGREDDVPPLYCATPTPTPTTTTTPTPTITPTPTVTATVTPNPGEFLLAITKTGTGVGTITSSPAGINCGDTCAASFPPGNVDLTVTTTNGSDTYFQGWHGNVDGTCTGPQRDCQLSMDQHRFLDAHLAPLDHNLMFVTSDSFAMDLGGTTPYDAACNQAASNAGLNNLAGDAFIAWVSDNSSTAGSRLGSARGFVRLDGKPVADQASALTSLNGAVLHPVLYNELGVRPIPAPQVATATLVNGLLADQNCADFTDATTAERVRVGLPTRGPAHWSDAGPIPFCSSPFPLYCVMTTKNAPAPAAPGGGKFIFQTNALIAIGEDLDARCDASKPAGAGAVKALVTTTTVPAADHLDPNEVYVRPDGHVVGTGAEIIAAAASTDGTNILQSGIWQEGDGTYLTFFVWTGDSGNDDMTMLGTVAGTCNNWTDSGGTGSAGVRTDVTSDFWRGFTARGCTAPGRAHCVEQ